ncbi:MAG: hypothetical protein K2L34_10445 [Muribaculaceae bacterium]|nr:hypothetical protein [Muribaculaceae bacterium]
METAPDSALSILKDVDTRDVKESQRPLFYLLLTKATVKSFQDIESDSLINIAAQYYDGKKDSLEVQAKMYYGMALEQEGRYEEAITPLTLAYDLAISLKEYRWAGIAARELSFSYDQLFIFENQLQWAQKAQEAFIKGNFMLHAAWEDISLIAGFKKNDQFEKAWNILENIDSCKPINDKYFLKDIRYQKASVLHNLNQPEKAIAEYESMLADSLELNTSIWYYLAQDYRLTGQPEKAAMALDSARSNAKSHLDSIWVTDMEAKAAAERGDYRKAYEYATDFGVEIMKDGDKRIGHPVSTTLTDTLREKYAVEQRLRESQHRIMWLWIAIGVLATVILGTVAWLLYMRLQSHKMELERMASQAQALRTDIANLTETADRKNRSTSEAMRDLLAANTRTLDRLCALWFRQPDSPKARQTWHKELMNELATLRSEERTAEMEDLINRNSEGWMAHFRETFPDLTKEQYRLALYLFLGFSYESIAILMDKGSVNTVYGAKNRLKTRLSQLDTPEALLLRSRLGM